MNRPSALARGLCLLLIAAGLVACGHARVVRVEPSARHDVYGSARPAPRSTSPTTPASAAPRVEPQPMPFSETVVVKPGETLYGIATRYGLRYQDVASWNGIEAPYSIRVGQRLRLSAPTAAMASSPTSMPTSTPAPATAVVPRAPPASAPPTAASAAPASAPSAPVVATAPVATPVVTAPPPASSAPPVTRAGATTDDDDGRAPVVATGGLRWRWPTRGQLIGRFVAGDQTQQGINIAGKAGQPVKAAADGVVVYSGAGLVGYGELIIIKHSEEWLSAYAHNRRRLVAEGSQVKAGDVIAEMGRTGAVSDMLHFEIRRNGRPVDPLQFLPPQ